MAAEHSSTPLPPSLVAAFEDRYELIRPCNHQFVRGARADFRTCTQGAAGSATLDFISNSKQGTGDPPIWIACAAGCCTAEDT